MKKQKKKKFRIFPKIKKLPTWVYYLLSRLLYLYRYTMRIKIEDRGDFLSHKPDSIITVSWHNRLLFIPILFSKEYKNNTYIIISASRDGEYIAAVFKMFGFNTVRGSSSKKGEKALREGLNVLKENKFLSMTSDGPRGPKYKVKPGALYFATQSGAKIIAISINYSRYWSLKSWDGFQIPKPFSTAHLIISEPIEVPQKLSKEELKKYRLIVENELMNITVD
jgi:lysophospholipid acyltransferase (LPLAT)-like uncharacterized protein